MNVNIEVLCPACKECKLFEIGEDKLYADGKVYETLRYCKHLEICENAVKIWEKQNELNKKAI